MPPLSVAVVDDDAGLRRAMGRLLLAAGFEPRPYASAEEYLEGAAQARPDCLVLDVHLASMSGFDLRDRLIERGEAPPIIFITANEALEATEHTARPECAAFLFKPVPGSVLLAAVRRAVGLRAFDAESDRFLGSSGGCTKVQ